jgi:hypothetical protein
MRQLPLDLEYPQEDLTKYNGTYKEKLISLLSAIPSPKFKMVEKWRF